MKFAKILSGLFLLTIFVGVLAKIIYVPITHDESFTITRYTPYSIFDLIMYPDTWPNNHIINSISVKISGFLFGFNHLSIRLVSIIAFIIYSYSCFKFSQLISKNNKLILFVFSIILFFGNPYFNDFFSLARGYALSNAFLLLSVYLITKAYKYKQDKFLWLAVLFASLSSYANFTALIYWAATIVLASLYFFLNRKKSIFPKKALTKLMLCILAYLSLIYNPIMKMARANEFKYWSSEGFFKETILSSVENWCLDGELFFEFDKSYLAYLVVVLYIIFLLFYGIRFIQSKEKQTYFSSPFSICFLLLSITILINLIQTFFLSTPNLTDRTALLYYPLFISTTIAFLSSFEDLNKKTIVLTKYLCLGMSILLIIHLSRSYTHRQVYEWAYDQYTIEVLEYLKKVDEPNITLQTHWMFNPSFSFYKWNNQAKHINLLPSNRNLNPNSEANYYYVFDIHIATLGSGYKKIKKFGNSRWLLKKL